MATVHSVPMSAKKFTKRDLENSLIYVNNTVAWPGLYNNTELGKKFPGLSYVDRRIIKIKDVHYDPDTETLEKFPLEIRAVHERNNFKMQKVRAKGRGENYPQVWESLNADGYELSHIPMSVCFLHDGTVHLMNGRTRIEELVRHGFENILADYYTCDDYFSFGKFALFSNPPESPRSPMKMEDIVTYALHEISIGRLKNNDDDVKKYIEDVTDGKASKGVVDKCLSRIRSKDNSVSLTYTDAEARIWLKDHGYHDNMNNNGIYYYIASKESAGSSVLAAASYCKGLLEDNKKVKELRIVINPGYLPGSDAAESWKKKIDDFRNNFLKNFTVIRDHYFKEYELKNMIKVFGAIPSVNSLAHKHPLDKIVMFTTGRLKYETFAEIDTKDSLNRFFDLEEVCE